MTPSATASPLIQLGSAAAPATAAATPSTSTENAATPSQGGGFQLLVDAATEQQLAAQAVGTAVAQTPVKPAAGTDETPADPGNVLPLAGLILPGVSEPQPVAKGDALPVDGDKPKEGTDADAASADTVIALPWVPVNIQPAAPKGADTALKTATDNKAKTAPVADPNAAAAAAPVVALAAQAGGLTVGTPVAAAQQQSDDTAQGDAVPLSTVSTSNRRGVSIDASKPSTNTATAIVPAADAKTDASADAGARKGDVASFADLLKPAAGDSQAQSAAPANAQVAVIDGSRAHQATRPFLDIDGNSVASATVSLPVGSSGWSDAVVDKVMWFSANHLSSAEIKLNPPDLGPLQVRISTQHDQASVVFSSPHAAVRDALDQALPKLREMFGGQGLQLSDASVGGQAQRQQQQSGDSGAAAQSRAGTWFGSEDNGDVPVAVTRVSGGRLSSSAVDAYA